jgi:hypothetical protein
MILVYIDFLCVIIPKTPLKYTWCILKALALIWHYQTPCNYDLFLFLFIFKIITVSLHYLLETYKYWGNLKPHTEISATPYFSDADFE